MKHFLLTFSLLIGVISVFSQTKLDTIVNQHTQQLQGIDKKMAGLQSNIDTIKVKLDTVKNSAGLSESKSKQCSDCKLGFWEWILVFSPILIFGIALLIIKGRLKDFKLDDALAEGELAKKTIQNPVYTSENLQALVNNPAMAASLTPTIEVSDDNYAKSSSRYIAFITSALTWIIALCLSSFFLYQYMKTNVAPNLSGLSNVLLALGIGVVPYAFNKISNAIK